MFGKRFRVYSIATIAIVFACGALTGTYTSRVQADLPTPWLGVRERLSSTAYMLWIVYAGTERPKTELVKRRFARQRNSERDVFGREDGRPIKSFKKAWRELFQLAGARELTSHTDSTAMNADPDRNDAKIGRSIDKLRRHEGCHVPAVFVLDVVIA